MEIFKTFTFDAAHRLTAVESAHPCSSVHGHTYRVSVHFEGPVAGNGMVIDFHDVKKAVKPIIDKLDHSLLNDHDGLGNPTSENIAIWIWDRIKPLLPQLSSVTVQETDGAGAIYRGQ